MRKNYTKNNSVRLAAYSTMAAALTAVVADANAEVIYTDIEDMTIEVGDQFDVDVDGDGTFDFRFSAGYASSSGGSIWSFGSGFGFVSSASVGNSSNQFCGSVGSYYNYGSALEEGALIGPDGAWLNYPSLSNSAVLASNFYGTPFGNFPGAGEMYLGFQFTVKGNLHYGWMRVEADIDPVYMTIFDYAYEAIPDQPIEAGSQVSLVSVEELAAGVANIYSFNATVNINLSQPLTNTYARVMSLNGETVFSAPMTDNSMRIDLSRVAKGNYLVQLVSDEGTTTKQVFIQ